MEILLSNEQKICRVNSGQLKERVKIILETLDCRNKEISILIVTDSRIRELNQQYRNIDDPTDVLSFPQHEGNPEGPGSHLLGDVVISAETAARQAGEHQLSLEEELVLLLIHGILHLLGYDHEKSREEEKKMKQKTSKVFEAVFPGRKPADSCNY